MGVPNLVLTGLGIAATQPPHLSSQKESTITGAGMAASPH